MTLLSDLTSEQRQTMMSIVLRSFSEQSRQMTASSIKTEREQNMMMNLISSLTPEEVQNVSSLISSLTQEQLKILIIILECIPEQSDTMKTSNLTPEQVKSMKTLISSLTREQLQIIVTLFCSLTPEQRQEITSNSTPEEVQTIMSLISSLSLEQRGTMKTFNLTHEQALNIKTTLISMVTNIIITFLNMSSTASQEQKGNDTEETRMSQQRSKAQPETTSCEASQRLFDFSAIRNNVGRFFYTDNSVDHDEPQEPTSQHDRRQPRGQRKRDDHKDDLDETQEPGNDMEETMMNQPRSSQHPETPLNETPRLKFVADADGDIFITPFKKDNSAMQENKGNDMEASRLKFVADVYGNIFITSLNTGGAASQEQKENDTGDTMIDRPRRKVQPKTPSCEAPQRLFDFSAIRNNVGRFFYTDNSVDHDEPQEPTSQHDGRQPRGQRKRDNHKDDLDETQEPGNDMEETMMNQPRSSQHPETPLNETPRLKFVADADGDIFITPFKKDNSAMQENKGNDMEASRLKFVADVYGNIFITSLNTGGAASQEQKENDTGDTMIDRPRRKVQPKTPSCEAPQRLFDFSAIRNNVGRFFYTDNSVDHDEPQEPTSQHDRRQPRGQRKRDDHKDDLDETQEPGNDMEETMMNQPRSSQHPETPLNETPRLKFVADGDGDIFITPFKKDNSAMQENKGNDMDASRQKFVADVYGNIFITSLNTGSAASQKQKENDTRDTMINRPRRKVQPETPSCEALEPQFVADVDDNMFHTPFKTDNFASQKEAGNDTEDATTNQPRSHRVQVQPQTSSNEAPQRQLDFSAILNNVGRFFNTDNSAGQNEPE